jgi:hypothetical protein
MEVGEARPFSMLSPDHLGLGPSNHTHNAGHVIESAYAEDPLPSFIQPLKMISHGLLTERVIEEYQTI